MRVSVAKHEWANEIPVRGIRYVRVDEAEEKLAEEIRKRTQVQESNAANYAAWMDAQQLLRESKAELAREREQGERLKGTLVPLRKALAGCNRCDYDEAEGDLVNHCDKCCRKVTAAAYQYVAALAEQGEGGE